VAKAAGPHRWAHGLARQEVRQARCSCTDAISLDVGILLFVFNVAAAHNWAVGWLYLVDGVSQCKVKSQVLAGLSGCDGGVVVRAAGQHGWAHG
jgi:hypothetical protein